MGIEYVPHMTIGNLKTSKELSHAYNQTKIITQSFETIVHEISVEMIGENEESIIVINKKLE